MASYQETGAKINARIKPILDKLDPSDKEQLINGVLWMGQVAKNKCRHPSAYASFCGIIFRDVVKLGKVPITVGDSSFSRTFDVLQVVDTVDIRDLVGE